MFICNFSALIHLEYYKTQYFCVFQGYLTDSGDVNLERVQMIMLELGKVEDEIFKTRQQKELQFKAREKAKKRRTEFSEHRPNWNLVKDTQFAPRVNF